jgi:hypothetical protein
LPLQLHLSLALGECPVVAVISFLTTGLLRQKRVMGEGALGALVIGVAKWAPSCRWSALHSPLAFVPRRNGTPEYRSWKPLELACTLWIAGVVCSIFSHHLLLLLS